MNQPLPAAQHAIATVLVLTNLGCVCRTLALILPDALQHTGKIMNAIYTSGFSIM